nr:hypothetical protein [Tanacetum cinerariifolium]
DLLQVVVWFALALMDFHELELMGDLLSIELLVGEEDLLTLEVPAVKIHRTKDQRVDPTLVVMKRMYLLKEKHFVVKEQGQSCHNLTPSKIYKPTEYNLHTSSNTSRANQDNTPRINRGIGYDIQRIVNVAGARENVGTPVVQQSGIQCYNCKEYRHVTRECQKLKRAKDAAYHKEKMLLCKQEEAGFQLNAEQAEWKDDTD